MTTFFTFSQEALTFVYIFWTRQNARQDILSREFLTMGTNFTIYFRIRNTALFTFVFLNTCSLYIRVFAEIYSIKLILSILIKIQMYHITYSIYIVISIKWNAIQNSVFYICFVQKYRVVAINKSKNNR